MWWHEQSWPTIQGLNKDLPVVLPLGSLEQHGHHLPLFVDTIQVSEIAARAEQALGDNALFLPTLWLGCSHHHLDFPGTVSLLPSLYSQVIKSAVGCILSAGFGRVFLLNGHGGNQVPMAQALTELIAEDDRADEAHLAAASWWQVGRPAMAAADHGMTTPFLSHACEYETSLMLAIRPDLVRTKLAANAKPTVDNGWWHSELGGKVSVFRRFYRVTAAGSMGAPAMASQKKGRSLLDAVTTQVVNFIADFSRWPSLPPLGPASHKGKTPTPIRRPSKRSKRT